MITKSTEQLTNRERIANWYAAAVFTGYELITGPRFDSYSISEYEREAMLDSAPSTDDYDFFEESSYEH